MVKEYVHKLLTRLIPDPSECRATANELRAAHPGETDRQIAHLAVRAARRRAVAAGAATGVFTSPITMLPAALADMSAVFKIEASLIGVVAGLLDPAVLDDPIALRADVLSIVFPAAASQALRQLGIHAGARLSHAAVQKYATEDMVRLLTRLAGVYLGRQVSRELLMVKALPLAAAGIGAGWNWLEVRAIGARAISYFSDEPSPDAKPIFTLPDARKLLPAARRLLPRPFKP